LRDTETITASRVCRSSVNHSNVHLITYFFILPCWRLNLPLDISQGTYCKNILKVKWEFLLTVYSGTVLPNWNQFIFNRQRTKEKLAQFFETGVH